MHSHLWEILQWDVVSPEIVKPERLSTRDGRLNESSQ
jgi:hypothetical protein